MSTGRGSGRGGDRQLTVKVRTAKRRSNASARWLERQLNDPYVAAAKREGYKSRAAYKLLGLDERHKLLRRGMRVLDLGAAPGGWSQVAAARVGSSGRVVAVDLLPFGPLPGVLCHELDVETPDSEARLAEWLGGAADLVLSDMAPSTTGHKTTDKIRIVALAEVAFEVAQAVLAPGGAFVVKLFEGGAHGAFLATLKRDFARVRHTKPPASRADSAELYLVAEGYRGTPPAATAPGSLGEC